MDYSKTKKDIYVDPENPYWSICPYFPERHRTKPVEMYSHVVKCRQQIRDGPSSDKWRLTQVCICPFSKFHHIQRIEFDLHLQECSERALFLQTLEITSKPIRHSPTAESLELGEWDLEDLEAEQKKNRAETKQVSVADPEGFTEVSYSRHHRRPPSALRERNL